MEAIKRDYPARQLLEGKTYAAHPEASVNLRASASAEKRRNTLGSNAPWSSSMEARNIDEIVAMAQSVNFDRRKRSVKEVIDEANESF